MRRKLVSLMALFLIGTAACGQEEADLSVDYVALGDSLAAGQNPYTEIGTGYTDMIAEELENEQQLSGYTKELAVPGYTTDEVLNSLKSPDAKEIVEAADLITISAGANDLLRLVQLDPATGQVSFNESRVEEQMEQVGDNISNLLSELNEQAPDAEVYVMGYYFPFPQLENTQKEALAEQLNRLNETLERAAGQQDAVFVPVDDAFGEAATDKLPNAADIHPNEEGYKAMAAAFFDTYPLEQNDH